MLICEHLINTFATSAFLTAELEYKYVSYHRCFISLK